MQKPISNPKKRFGEAVRKRRNELQLSQEKLAEKARLHRTYIADIERGERNISLESIVKVIQALDLTLEQFFGQYF
jgi:transcriptional regulator with XRE-family HTH domain